MMNPLMNSGMHMVNGNSINSINSIFLGSMDHQNGGSIAAHNNQIMQNSGQLYASSLLSKSNASGASLTSSNTVNRGVLSFADRLKIAYD